MNRYNPPLARQNRTGDTSLNSVRTVGVRPVDSDGRFVAVNSRQRGAQTVMVGYNEGDRGPGWVKVESGLAGMRPEAAQVALDKTTVNMTMVDSVAGTETGSMRISPAARTTSDERCL